MSKSATTATPITLVRELRECADAQKAASAANTAWAAWRKRIDATVAAAEKVTDKAAGRETRTVAIGATAYVSVAKTPKDAPKFDESAAREAYAAALAAREALESGNAAEALALLHTLPATLDPITHSDGRTTYTVSL